MNARAFIASAWDGAVIAAVGAPQTGKSRLLKEAAAAGELGSRVVVFEPHGRRDRVEKARGKRIWPWPGQVVGVRELLQRPELIDRDPLRVVVVPDRLDADALGKQFAAVARLCWHSGDLTLIAEEAAIYARHAIEAANLLSTGSAHAGLRLLMISQSWTRIPIDVRRCVSHLVAFAQSEPADVEAIGKRAGKSFAARVARLTRGSAPLCWALGDSAAA